MPLVMDSQPPRARNSTAEASCSEVMNEKRPPTSTPFQIMGSVTSLNVRTPEAPTLEAASSSERCTSSSEANDPRTVYGSRRTASTSGMMIQNEVSPRSKPGRSKWKARM